MYLSGLDCYYYNPRPAGDVDTCMSNVEEIKRCFSSHRSCCYAEYCIACLRVIHLSICYHYIPIYVMYDKR